MVLNWTVVVNIGTGFIIGSYISYLQMTIHQLYRRIEEILMEIPTPEDMAREVVKIKLPISELPPGFAEKLRSGMTIPGMPPSLPDGKPVIPPSLKKKQKPIEEYTG